MDRHRILVLIKGLGIGGAEKLISEGARHWDRSRFDYRVAYLLPWKDQLVEEIHGLGVPVDQLGTGSMASGVVPLRRLLGAWRPDLIHAHLPTTGILARVVSTGPVVYTEHNIAGSYRQPTRALNRLTYRRNDAVIAVSAAVAESLSAYPGPTPQVIPNGVSVRVDVARRDAVRSELELADRAPLIVHVGNIRPDKGHAALIEVAHLLGQTHPDALIVSIGGEKHAGDLARLETLATERGVGRTLRFLGRRPNAVDYIAAADVFVNPADVEGLPVALLEAMAVGTPVAVTAVGGVPSVVSDMENGLLVSPGDAGALASAIRRLLDDPALAAGLSRQAGATVEARFSLGRMIGEVESVYDRLLSR